MPPRLGRLFPTTFTGKPPHMAGRDLGIWAKWRQQLPFPYEGFFFDVALGTPPTAAPDVRPEVNRAWEFLLAKRIDAVGVLPGAFHIIEVRRGADQAAIGALDMYCFLWREDPPDQRNCTPILVTDRLEQATSLLASRKGIVTFEVP